MLLSHNPRNWEVDLKNGGRCEAETPPVQCFCSVSRFFFEPTCSCLITLPTVRLAWLLPLPLMGMTLD